MNLKKYLVENYGSQYKFAKANNLEPQKVYYWCKKDWKKLSYNVREKICNLLGLDVDDY